MNKLHKSIVAITLIATTSATPMSALAATTPAPAAAPPTGQALEISPPVLDLVANPGQVLTANLSIRNVSRGNLVVTASADDFTAGGEDGNPKLLLDPTETTPFTMKAWVRPIPRLVLVPREIKTMKLTIAVPANASPGGHYGVIRFTATPPELEGQGVALSASLGSLTLVRVNGAVTESMKIKEFAVKKNGKSGTFFQNAPLTFMERLENTGNVHLQPTGQVKIVDMFGRRLTNLNVNMPPRNVLPASIRKFETQLNEEAIGTKFLFGRYTATLDMKYGESKKPLTQTLTFWVVPYKLIITIIILVVVAFLVLRFAIKRYNNFIIGKSSGQSRSKPKRRK